MKKTIIKLVFISDTHNKYNALDIPKCDILISTGDYSMRGLPKEVQSFHEWLAKQNAKHKISIQGNHELWVEKNFNAAKDIALEACPRVNFIDEGLVEIADLKIWCSAITPWFCDWAWNRNRGTDIKRHWDLIPDDIDILATHGPPYGYGDFVEWDALNVGCKDLLDRIEEVHPIISAYGHIHQGYGIYKNKHTTFVNASTCDEGYKPVNLPIVIEIDKDKRTINVINEKIV